MVAVGDVAFFFFSSRRRHTRFKCDWSSDVCSSDLSTPLCGEVVFEGTHAFITPIAKVPPGFEYAWKHEIAEPEKLKGLDGYPIALLDWSIESNSSSDRLQVHEFRKLLYGSDLGSPFKT